MTAQQPNFNIISHHLNGLHREMRLLPSDQPEMAPFLQRVQQIQDQIRKSHEQTRVDMHQMQDQMQRRMQLIWEEMRVLRDQVKEVGGGVDGVRGEIGEMSGQINGLHCGVKEVCGQISGLYCGMKEVCGQISGLHGEVKEVRGQVNGVYDEVKWVREIQDQLREQDMEQGMVTMRLHNGAPGNYATLIRFPPGVVCDDLPKTRADLMRLTQAQCQGVANALGLPPAPAFPVTESCRQILEFLGIKL